MSRVEVDTSINYTQLEKDLAKVQRKIHDTKNKIEQDRIQLRVAVDDLKSKAVIRNAERANVARLRGDLANVGTLEARNAELDLPGAEARLKAAEKGFNRAKAAADRFQASIDKSKAALQVMAKEEERIAPILQQKEETTAQTATNQESAADATEQTAVATEKAAVSQEGLRVETNATVKSIEKLTRRIIGLAKRVFFFSVITSILRETRSYIMGVIRQNDAAAESIGRLKGAFNTLLSPLISAVLPVLTAVANAVTHIINVILTMVALLTGKTVKAFSDTAKAAKKTGGAAGKASKQLAAFDTVQKLGDSGGGGGGGGGVSDAIEPLYDLENIKLPEWLEKLLGGVKLKIDKLQLDWSDTGLTKEKIIEGITTLIMALLGGMFFGVPGAVFGAMIGAVLGVSITEWADKQKNPDGTKQLLMILLGTILATILGGMFGGWAGGTLGALVGMNIMLNLMTFNKDGSFNKEAAWNSLKTTLTSIFGLIVGARIFKSFTGGTLGLAIGALIGFGMMLFNDEVTGTNRTVAAAGFGAALGTILGTIIGFYFGGVVGAELGGLAGGIIGLTLGLSIKFFIDKVDTAAIDNARRKAEAYANGEISNPFSKGSGKKKLKSSGVVVPEFYGLANGAVIPPNREFMAVLGDQKSGTNIEAPLETMVQAFRMANQGQNINIRFTGTLAEVARMLKPEIDYEGFRTGEPIGGTL